MSPTPEQNARQGIDAALAAAGWIVQDRAAMNLAAGPGGQSSLRAYLLAVLQPVTSLRFTVQRIIWDPSSSELAIIYDRDINGQHDRAVEILHFGSSGRVDRGEVLYGVVPNTR